MKSIFKSPRSVFSMLALAALFFVAGASDSVAQCSKVNSSEVTPLAGQKAVVDWDDSGASTYFVRYREIGSGSYTQVDAESNGTASVAILTGLTNGATYEYKIFAQCPGKIKGSSIMTFVNNP